MRMLVSLFCLLCLAPPSARATASLRDAFHAQAAVKSAEEESRLLRALEADSKEAEQAEARLTEARIRYHSIRQVDAEDLEPWQRELLDGKKIARGPHPNPQHLSFLQTYLPEARQFSAFEWQLVEQWFGNPTQEAFLRWAFAADEVAQEESKEDPPLLWIQNSHRIMGSAAVAEEAAMKALGAEPLRLSAFARIEEQAEELRRQLVERSGSALLVSSGEASAVVLKMLDLHPGIRQNPHLLGWINVDGKLYGESSARAPASSANANIEAEQRRRLRRDAIERPTPLIDGFPIVNLVSTDKNHRPGRDLRPCLVPDGSTKIVSKGSAWKALRRSWPLPKRG